MGEKEILKRKARVLLFIVVAGLIVSGVSAVPLRWETKVLDDMFGEGTYVEGAFPGLSRWITKVARGVEECAGKDPFMLYGTDWPAFAHFMIAVAFIGPLIDPVKNIRVVKFGMIASVTVIPTALVFGYLRGIPYLWRLIDCSFGVPALIPLYAAYHYIRRIEGMQ